MGSSCTFWAEKQRFWLSITPLLPPLPRNQSPNLGLRSPNPCGRAATSGCPSAASSPLRSPSPSSSSAASSTSRPQVSIRPTAPILPFLGGTLCRGGDVGGLRPPPQVSAPCVGFSTQLPFMPWLRFVPRHSSLFSPFSFTSLHHFPFFSPKFTVFLFFALILLDLLAPNSAHFALNSANFPQVLLFLP